MPGNWAKAFNAGTPNAPSTKKATARELSGLCFDNLRLKPELSIIKMQRRT
jgi:hypothetical protein